MLGRYNRCCNCEYFKRLCMYENKKYIATQYGLCEKRKKVFADKYYCGNHKQEGGNYDNSKSG